MTRQLTSLALISFMVAGCADGDFVAPPAEPATWSQVEQSQGAALLSVHGTSDRDVWFSGADDGTGPLLVHYDGTSFQRIPSGVRGDLWWTHATVPGGPVFFGGADANLLRYQDGRFERLTTPGLGKHTVYGVWAASSTDVYAVGSAAGRNGFIWHYDGQSFRDLALPADMPQNDKHDVPGLFKVWGTSARDVWVVGGNGVVLRGNAERGFQRLPSMSQSTLFTVHAHDGRVVIVGGGDGGVLFEAEGDEIRELTPAASPLLQGACVANDGAVWAVGMGGSIYESRGGSFEPVDPGIDFTATQSLHATWVDPSGGVWAVGGNVLTPKLDAGIAIHRGVGLPRFDVPAPVIPAAVCPESAIDPAPHGSIARRWNEQILGAIRRDLPRPTVHARNLFHSSVAIWDAWAAYDSRAEGYLVSEHHTARDVQAAREEAISYAAYRVLSHRYASAIGGAISQACFDAFMQRLGYDPADTGVEGDSPRAFGNRVGMAVVERFAEDGANEADNYRSTQSFSNGVPNLVVDLPGTDTQNPILWQKLVLAKAATQNGIPTDAGAQDYIGAHWGGVEPFAIERPAPDEPYLDIGKAPLEADDDLVDAALEVLRKSSELDSEDHVSIDISPGAYGNNSLGTNDGAGHRRNPVTGRAYASQRVKRGDFTRVLAEFWADGPNSETPPGHWNTLANGVADSDGFERRLFGEGEPLSALDWDVHLYLALNGAEHDAAIAAWELKRKYATARPITLIRYFGSLGQRSDPSLPSYDPRGLPLVEGLVELITPQSSAPGGRHAHLARYVGELAVRSFRGEPGDRVRELAGVGWVRVQDWMPYQRRTFVTPAFPGYVSGHSTFSRAAAVVLSELTGSEYFPGGLAGYTVNPGGLTFERGPTAAVRLEWATYFDAADQAGQSRLWGGIHIRNDDFDGRKIGARVGERAVARARKFF
ncbi:MAG TPA: vanadium-dependent haloperoxidase [Polyangiaceae bacterium]|nr:vanadium-dependent haloperoxidase [Polyangiaceae bacterium]